jgi:hypothetical protein
MRLLLPAPKSAAMRSDTVADSDVSSTQPPELSVSETRIANGAARKTISSATRATGRRRRYTNLPQAANTTAPFAATRTLPTDGVARTIKNEYSFCKPPVTASCCVTAHCGGYSRMTVLDAAPSRSLA